MLEHNGEPNMSSTQTSAAIQAVVPPAVVLAAQPTTPSAPTSYASQVNSYYNSTANNCIPLSQRYVDTIAAMPDAEVSWVQQMLTHSTNEFTRLHPTVKAWNDLTLAQSVRLKLSAIYIDTTMQRFLDLHWVAKLLAKFKTTKVIPIQVYLDDQGRYCAWDGQHTAVLLWVICTIILGLDPDDVDVPVNIYPSSKKSEMRECFLDLNSSEGKKALDLIDHWIQQVFGVRIDGSANPAWVLTEKKQKVLERYNLFVTHDKFNNTHMPGAISRLQEINKLDLIAVEWLAEYLSTVMKSQRAAEEKEVVMMAHFFLRCRIDNVKVDSAYIQRLAMVASTLWNADFSPKGPFWNQVKIAYTNWHQNDPANIYVSPKVSNEPLHGFPFMLAQLTKSMPGVALPRNSSNSNFWPMQQDLF